MPSEQDLLRALDDEPGTPSTVDVTKAITAGRRRLRRRRAGYVGAAAVTAIAVTGASLAGRVITDAAPDTAPAPAASTTVVPKPAYTIPGTADWTPVAATPPSRCALEQLRTPDNVRMALVSGADPTGRYIVGRAYPRSGAYQAVLWRDGRPEKVQLPGDIEESLRDVNSAGAAVGWSYAGRTDADTGPVPYAYRGGRVTKLAGVPRGSAEAINEAGAIVGQDDRARAAVFWPSADEKPVRLPVPAGSSSTASDIDEDGTTVGTLDDAVPYVWFADGRHRALPLPGKVRAARVFTIRNGWATGVGDAEAGAATAIRWNVRTGEVRVWPELEIRASAANAHGWQIGTDRKGRATLIADGRTVVLPDLAKHAPGELANIPTTLTDDARLIAGQSDDRTGTIRAVVWRCG